MSRTVFIAVVGVACTLLQCSSADAPEESWIPWTRPDAKTDVIPDSPLRADVESKSDQGPQVDVFEESKGPFPIVLVHGMGGFGTLKGLPITYFNNIESNLKANGEAQVFTVILSPYTTSENRASELAKQVNSILSQTGKSKVNLIGHSQGGLDSRILASPNGLAYGDRVASVTTIATPHFGSRVADIVLKILKPLPPYTVDQIANAVAKLLEIAVYELTTDPSMRAQVTQISEKNMIDSFNVKYVDDPRVKYFSYAGRTNKHKGLPDCISALYPDDAEKVDEAMFPLSLTAQVLEDGQGKANDGLVTVQSARWGTFMQCIPADHMSEVGQINMTAPDPLSGYDHLAFFRTVVARLRERQL